jgi:hypothetical protein
MSEASRIHPCVKPEHLITGPHDSAACTHSAACSLHSAASHPLGYLHPHPIPHLHPNPNPVASLPPPTLPWLPSPPRRHASVLISSWSRMQLQGALWMCVWFATITFLKSQSVSSSLFPLDWFLFRVQGLLSLPRGRRSCPRQRDSCRRLSPATHRQSRFRRTGLMISRTARGTRR